MATKRELLVLAAQTSTQPEVKRILQTVLGKAKTKEAMYYLKQWQKTNKLPKVGTTMDYSDINEQIYRDFERAFESRGMELRDSGGYLEVVSG